MKKREGFIEPGSCHLWFGEKRRLCGKTLFSARGAGFEKLPGSMLDVTVRRLAGLPSS